MSLSTIKDVARLSGVSPITASRALNKPDIVHPRTVAKVQEAARQLGYRPSSLAQGLRKGQTRIVTLVIKQKDTYDPLSFEFATGISEACRRHGYSLLIYPVSGADDFKPLQSRVDGLILTDIRDPDHRIDELKSQLPVAIFGQNQVDVPQIDVDNVWGASVATEHLLSLGYRDVVLISSDADSDLIFLKHREQGYRRTMQARGFVPSSVYGSTFDIKGGYAALAALPYIPEAIVCVADVMALGVMRYLHEHRVNVPVVGYDGGYLTEVSTPMLTSVKQPFYTVGERLAEALFEFMRTGTVIRELVRPELSIKESTWPKGSRPA